MKTMNTCTCLLVATSIALAGCSAAVPERTDDEVGQVHHSAALTTVSPSNAQGAGFFHSIANSKFHLGATPITSSDLGLNKVIGSEGVFATDPRNGSVRAILNSTSPTLTGFQPLTTDPAVHNARVLAYFEAAGLPPAQVGDVFVMPGKRGGSDTLGNVQDELTDLATVIHRVVAGFRVPDSYAWAIFDANDEVVQEGVHWPAIPNAAIVDAQSLQTIVSDANQYATFRASLPPEAAAVTGHVVIRHGGVAEANPSPFASYDVFVKVAGSRGGVRHFDSTGKELIHPSSVPHGPSNAKP